MHKDIPLQTRVIVDAQYLGKDVTGTVGGIASMHVVFHYIVVLDEPHVFEDETYTAISVIGSHLKNLDGEFAWRLER